MTLCKTCHDVKEAADIAAIAANDASRTARESVALAEKQARIARDDGKKADVATVMSATMEAAVREAKKQHKLGHHGDTISPDDD